MTILPRWFQSSHYTPLPLDSHDHHVPDEEVDVHLPSSLHLTAKRTRFLSLTVLILLVGLAGTAGFVLGVLVSPNRRGSDPTPPDTVPRGSTPSPLLPYSKGLIRLTLGVLLVSTGWVTETFRYNDSFAAPPPRTGGKEPIWDSLIPNGLGYIQQPHLAPNLSVISVFHQLHCLYTLRRAYYSPPSSSSSSLEDFDFGIERAPHTAHCFEYLRQSLMCSADSSVEPAGEMVQGFLGWGFRRRCRDYGRLKEWAERWRAFEGHGFIAMPAEVH